MTTHARRHPRFCTGRPKDGFARVHPVFVRASRSLFRSVEQAFTELARRRVGVQVLHGQALERAIDQQVAQPVRQAPSWLPLAGTADSARRAVAGEDQSCFSVSTPSATDAIRACFESAREVSTIGTLAPSTSPAQSPPPT